MYDVNIDELDSLEIDNLKVMKKRLKYEIQSMEDGEQKESKKEYLEAIDDVLDKKSELVYEDAAGGGDAGGGVAAASAASVAGMGNVTSAQPGNFAGSTTGGEEGSGDYGVPLYTYSKAGGGATGNRTHKGGKMKAPKGKKLTNMLADFITKYKKNDGKKYEGPGRDSNGKLMSYQDFAKSTLDKVTKVKESINEEYGMPEIDSGDACQEFMDWIQDMGGFDFYDGAEDFRQKFHQVFNSGKTPEEKAQTLTSFLEDKWGLYDGWQMTYDELIDVFERNQ